MLSLLLLLLLLFPLLLLLLSLLWEQMVLWEFPVLLEEQGHMVLVLWFARGQKDVWVVLLAIAKPGKSETGVMVFLKKKA